MRTLTHKPQATPQTAAARTTLPARARFGQNLAASSIPGLQSTLGNQATRRLLEATARDVKKPKLTINDPDDQYEREADAVADRVKNMKVPPVQARSVNISALQRKCAHCEEEEKNELQRKERNGVEQAADGELGNYIGNLDGGGQPLPGEARNYYEARFGYDFSSVRVHTDSAAAKSAQSVNALAYTSGNNIVFDAGQFSPFAGGGSKLLAHELTHVVQQSGGVQPRSVQRQPATDPSARDPFYVQPGGPFDVGDNICTFRFGGGGWEACCPVPGAAPGSDNACFSDESLDRVKEWARRRGYDLPNVQCPEGRIPNLMLGYCCPPGQVPQGVQCVAPQQAPPVPPPCPPGQRTLLGQCCTPPTIPMGTSCVNPQQATPPTPSPGGSGLNVNFTIGVLDDYNINEFTMNNRQRPAWAGILHQVHQSMEACPQSFMVVTGFTDSPGDDQYNLDLGKRRADDIKMTLQLSLLDIPTALPVFIISRSEGENNPVDTAAGPNYSARNRRVEIQFHSVCPALPGSLTPPRR